MPELKKKRINYYPFGLKHKGYNNNPVGPDHPYGYNGKEEQNDLSLGWIDLGARMLDPALGRFMTIDPMADFINYQSPYVLADNNPIANIDFYGLGKKRCGWLCRAFNRLVFGKNNVNSRSGRKLKSKIGKSRGTGWDDIASKKKETNSNDDDCTDCGTKIARPRMNITGSNLSGEKIGALPVSKLRISKPKLRIKIGGKTIFANKKFEGQVEFHGMTDLIKRNDLNDKTLNDLIKTLVDYPHIRMLIIGNNSFEPENRKGQTYNTPARTNGYGTKPNTTIRGAHLQRAEAIRQFLIGRGIKGSRLEIGVGEIRFTGQKGRTTSFIIKE